MNCYGLPSVAIYIALANSEARILSNPYAHKTVLVDVALLQSSRAICQDQNASRFSVIDPTSSNNRIGPSLDAQFLVLLVSEDFAAFYDSVPAIVDEDAVAPTIVDSTLFYDRLSSRVDQNICLRVVEHLAAFDVSGAMVVKVQRVLLTLVNLTLTDGYTAVVPNLNPGE